MPREVLFDVDGKTHRGAMLTPEDDYVAVVSQDEDMEIALLRRDEVTVID